MKNFKRISYIAIIFLIVCFSLVSIFGFETRWGESLNTHFKGAKNLQWDGNFDDEAIITLNYEQNLNQNTKESVESILKKRLALAGFGENKIYFSVLLNLGNKSDNNVVNIFEINLKNINNTKSDIILTFENDEIHDEEYNVQFSGINNIEIFSQKI